MIFHLLRNPFDPRRLWKSLFGKIAFVFSVLLLLLAGVQILVTFHLWGRSLERAEQITQWNAASALADTIRSRVGEKGNLSDLEQVVLEFSRNNGRTSVFLLDQHGGVFHSFLKEGILRQGGVDMAPIREFLIADPAIDAPVFGDNPADSDESSIFSVAPLRFRGLDLFVYVLFTNASWKNISQIDYENSIIYLIAIWCGISAFVVLLIGGLFFYPLEKRFSRILQAVKTFHNGDFRNRISSGGSDELGTLSAVIDEMAEKIERSMGDLEERDELRRELIASVSHDLRGPLMNIKGHIEQIQQQGTDSFMDSLSPLRRNLQSLSDLLDQLFELAKLEAQELHPDYEKFPLDELIQDLAAGYSARADALGIRLKTIFEKQPLFAYGDIRILDRVLLNLLENALKFTPKDGVISISAFEVQGKVRVSVSDTGKGIPETEIGKIFGKFYQGQEGVKRKGSAGLGLAIVERLLRVHQSSIQVESEAGQGTRFWFELQKPPSSPSSE